MVFDAVGPSYFASSHEDIPDDGTRSYPVDAGPSSYCYGGGPYDYDESGKDDVDLEYCKFCGDARNKPSRGRDPHRKKSPYVVLRQKRGRCVIHPDVNAWKYFDQMYPDFAEEPHNVRLDLCTYSFAPHGQYYRTYSCWPVIIIPYNLPPHICMSSEYIFLTMLWHVGVRTYDHATDRAFIMRAALMWTVNDLPAYGMASGWSIAGVMGCPICMDDTRAFHLQHGDQILNRVANITPAVEMPLSLPDSYGSDHKWTKKSIFRDLPYW
ncbi:UNVERIFIED_CONTAM: hypothetical protein Scaly_2664400 [Sesamum calycinum]|uniref:Uncharacterized protein n=1 Tax=Sesamum calycinum TaxID=2727403 RepID=A0AAW2J872_9LAMI